MKLNIYADSAADPQLREQVVTGFLNGLNTIQDTRSIKDTELSVLENIVYVVDGIEPRQGIQQLGNQVESGALSQGAITLKREDKTKIDLQMCNGKLFKLVGSTWTRVGTKTWNTTAPTFMLQVNDYAIILNGIDNFSYTDGTNITDYIAISDPTNSPTVAAVGLAGSASIKYTYAYTGATARGETVVSPTFNFTATNPLSTSFIGRVTITSIPGADRYNIYRTAANGKDLFLLYTIYGNGTTTFDDIGYTQSSVKIPPEANMTAGLKGKKALFTPGGRIYSFDDNTLYYGGTGTEVFNFSFAENAGGATKIAPRDSQIIRDIQLYQGDVIVLKDTTSYRFAFVNGLPSVQQISATVGSVSYRSSVIVENDLVSVARKDDRIAVMTQGQEANYIGQYRSNELSTKVVKTLYDVNMSALDQIAVFYYNNILGIAYPSSSSSINDKILCLDTRFGSWFMWKGFNPSYFWIRTDTANTQKLMCADYSGKMHTMFSGKYNDNGVAIVSSLSTKNFDMGHYDKYKEFYEPTLQLFDVNSSAKLRLKIMLDADIVDQTLNIFSQSYQGAGIGAMLPGQFLPGTATGGTSSEDYSVDTLVETRNFIGNSRYINFTLTSSELNAYWRLRSLGIVYSLNEEQRIHSRHGVYLQ